VVLNAAAAIYLSGKANNMKRAVEMAQNSLNQGMAQKKMHDLITISNS
jgi:anthranilate phosphoribosyltransferase